MIPLSLPKNRPTNNLSVDSSQLARLGLSLKANGNLQMVIATDYSNYVKNHARGANFKSSRLEARRVHAAKAGTKTGVNKLLVTRTCCSLKQALRNVSSTSACEQAFGKDLKQSNCLVWSGAQRTLKCR